jgi:hypothetical protein
MSTQLERLAVEILGLPRKSRALLAEEVFRQLEEELG